MFTLENNATQAHININDRYDLKLETDCFVDGLHILSEKTGQYLLGVNYENGYIEISVFADQELDEPTEVIRFKPEEVI